MNKVIAAFAALALSGAVALGQGTSKVEPIDGLTRPVRDSMLDQAVGHWQINRMMGGKPSESTVDAAWVLNHQFLQLHYVPDRASPQPYEAIAYIGYDNMSERYVVHWLDIFGGRISETLGFGKRTPNGMEFTFEYPDGPFTNTFRYDRQTRSWNLLLRQKNARGEWTTFATEQWRRQQ